MGLTKWIQRTVSLRTLLSTVRIYHNRMSMKWTKDSSNNGDDDALSVSDTCDCFLKVSADTGRDALSEWMGPKAGMYRAAPDRNYIIVHSLWTTSNSSPFTLPPCFFVNTWNFYRWTHLLIINISCTELNLYTVIDERDGTRKWLSNRT